MNKERQGASRRSIGGEIYVPFCNQKTLYAFCDMVNEKLKEYEK